MDVDGDNDDVRTCPNGARTKGMTLLVEQLQRKADDLVRLALFSEQRRTPLKREEINKKGPSYLNARSIV
jgi:hypothetical protein